MSPTRRDLLRFGAATLVGVALPMGHKPAALAAENTGVDVLDADDAAIIVQSGKGVLWLALDSADAHDHCAAELRVDVFEDGSARLTIVECGAGGHPSASRVVRLDADTALMVWDAVFAFPGREDVIAITRKPYAA